MKLTNVVSLCCFAAAAYAVEQDAGAEDRAQRRSNMSGALRRHLQDGDNDGTCFSADTLVHDVQGRPIAMKDLKLGDEIITANGKPTKVISFHHINHDLTTTFLRFQHENGALEITHKHFVPLHSGAVRAAKDIAVGQTLAGPNGSKVVVQAIEEVTKQGIYAPLTVSGDLVVDGVVVSSYASLLSTVSPAVQNSLFHAAYAPQRMYCAMASCDKETYYGGEYNWMLYHVGLPLEAIHEMATWAVVPALIGGMAMIQSHKK